MSNNIRPQETAGHHASSLHYSYMMWFLWVT